MVKVAEEWLAVCGGCEVTVLDVGEPLVDLLPQLEFVHIPVLMDHKYYGQIGEKTELEIPEADVGIISGGVRLEEHKHIAEEMRKKCKTIIASGACANFGGVPALGNMYNNEEIFDVVYRKTKSTDPGETPSVDIPPFTDRVYALDEVIKVDISLPGCPTTPELVAEALTALLEGKTFTLPEKSVCEDCPLTREKKALTALKRPLEQPQPERCLLELGYLCIGPATRTGCGGAEKVPRCIRANMPCRGCFGPIRVGANPLVDMMGALSAIGLDPKDIVDRRAMFNRYIGGQGRLKPLPAR
ncbi:MAG: methyl viologen-reducing hydrogenase [Candidatus Hydrothermarchaeales archaeon]